MGAHGDGAWDTAADGAFACLFEDLAEGGPLLGGGRLGGHGLGGGVWVGDGGKWGGGRGAKGGLKREADGGDRVAVGLYRVDVDGVRIVGFVPTCAMWMACWRRGGVMSLVAGPGVGIGGNFFT